MSAEGLAPAGAERSGARRLFFIRHGETDWNAEGRLQGQRDIPINARGREQAVDAAHRLREVRPDPGALPWIVSPLGRTRETAELARAALGLDPTAYTTDERLKEISFGRWEGFTWREIRKTEPEAARDRERGKWTLRPAGRRKLRDAGRAYTPVGGRDLRATTSSSRMAASPGRSCIFSPEFPASRPRQPRSGRAGCWCSKRAGFSGSEAPSAGLPAHLTFPFMNVHPRFRDRLQLSAPS